VTPVTIGDGSSRAALFRRRGMLHCNQGAQGGYRYPKRIGLSIGRVIIEILLLYFDSRERLTRGY
jgi:hypothetical protein